MYLFLIIKVGHVVGFFFAPQFSVFRFTRGPAKLLWGWNKIWTQLTSHEMVNHTALFLHTSQKPQSIDHRQVHFLYNTDVQTLAETNTKITQQRRQRSIQKLCHKIIFRLKHKPVKGFFIEGFCTVSVWTAETESNGVYFNARMITSQRWQLVWKQMVQQKPTLAFMKRGWWENKDLLWQLKQSCA